MGQHQHAPHHHEHNHDHAKNHSAHDHPHGPGHHHGPNNKAGQMIAFIITTGIMLLEFFGGLISSSLALVSDSGHMLSDSAALAMSLLAMWLAAKPASSNKSYGFLRLEILAALFNGVSLFVISGFINALLILKSAWGVIRWSVHILMEGTPIVIDAGKVKQTLLTIQGVRDVHDLHIWTMTSGRDSLTQKFPS